MPAPVAYTHRLMRYTLRCLDHVPDHPGASLDYQPVHADELTHRTTCSYHGCGVDVIETAITDHGVCPTCRGVGADPTDPGDWVPEVGMHNPAIAAPCPDCGGTGKACTHEAWDVVSEWPEKVGGPNGVPWIQAGEQPTGRWHKARRCNDCGQMLPEIIEDTPHWDFQPAPPKTCGAWGGCPLPHGHNTGRADIPSNHHSRTPCTDPPCGADDGHPCDTHATEIDHAKGNHEHCGVTCDITFPTEMLRNTILYSAIPGSATMLKELERRAKAHHEKLWKDQEQENGKIVDKLRAAEAHAPSHTWTVESPRRDNWASWGSWGTTYDDRDWALKSYEHSTKNSPARPFRLVRATTTYTIEAEHTPPTARHAVGEQPHTGGNAENCPRCRPEIDKTVLYPWICPGPDTDSQENPR